MGVTQTAIRWAGLVNAVAGVCVERVTLITK